VLVTALLSRIFLNNIQHRHHILGLILVTLSLVVLGLDSVFKDDPNVKQTNLLGIVMMLLSLVFTGVQFIVEEKLLKGYQIDALKVVGLEGMWGSLIYVIALVVLQFVRCDSYSGKEDMCAVNDKGEWRVEDSLFALKQMFANGFLCFTVIGATFTIALYNWSGVSVTKYTITI